MLTDRLIAPIYYFGPFMAALSWAPYLGYRALVILAVTSSVFCLWRVTRGWL